MDPKDMDRMMSNLMKFNELLNSSEYKQAHQLLTRHTKDLKKYVPSDHPSLVSVMHNQAMVLKLEGNLADAKKKLKIIVKKYENIYGLYHPSTLSALTNLGQVYSDLN